MTAKELRGCPFCGGKVRAVRGLMNLLLFKCKSDKCGAVMSFDQNEANNFPEIAFVLYNRRAEDGNHEKTT